MNLPAQAAVMWLVLTPVCATAESEVSDNPLLRHLIVAGVDVGDQHAKLPPPTLKDGLDAREQREAVTRVADRHGWNRFVRNSVVAPVRMKLAYVKDQQGRRIGHAVDAWFVVHGSLDKLSDDALLRSSLAKESTLQEGKAEELDASRLADIGIQRFQHDGFREHFVLAQFPLLGRVRLSGVVRAISSRSQRSMSVAWEVDERFAADTDLRGRWQSIRSDELGRKTLGPARPYQGCGGYGKITQIADIADALFVEFHFVFHEPEDWFSGSNLLRSKMPVLIQEGARKFRRQLKRSRLSNAP